MSVRTLALFVLIVCFLLCAGSDQKIITAKLGQDVILPCKVPNNIIITAVEWNRPEMEPEYVLLYRHGRLDPDSQHPSYQNRVDLQDKEMKDGDVSLNLKNVKMEDTGIYECLVFQGRKNEPISIINLEVHLSGDQDGGNTVGEGKGVASAGSVVNEILLLSVISVGILISRRHLKRK